MGCSGSTERGVSPQQKASQRQKISFQVGDNVKVKGPPTVIFVFGGPGSKKGKLVTDLTQTYGFQLINVESIVLEDVGERKKADTEESTMNANTDIQDNIKDETDKVSLAWVLEKIAQLIEQNSSGLYLVDIMPNLRLLVRNDNLTKNCAKDIETFENKFPISFALDFALPLEKITRKHDAKVPKIGESEQAVKSDEADSTRTKRRAALFDQNVKPFLDFFKDLGRLITIDVSCGHYESIWAKVCDVFADLQLQYCSNGNTVIIFSFDGNEVEVIDLPLYQLHLIVMRDHVRETDTEEEVLSTLYRVMQKSGPTVTNFIVDLRSTALAKCRKVDEETELTKESEKAIVFLDDEGIHLDKYVAMQAKGNPCNLHFRVISSPENRVFLFSRNLDVTLCKRIALFSPPR